MIKYIRNLQNFIKKNFIFILPFIILLIFIISIWDNNFYLGGDLMYPINAKSTISKSIFVWDQQNGGQNFFGYATLLWESFFFILQIFSISPSYSEKILIILMFSLGFVFTFLCYRLLFKNTKFNNKKLVIFSAFIFCLNPAVVLMPGAYPPLFAFPICYYFLIKFLDSNKLKFLIPFALFLNFHYFTDFPQPKLLVVFGLSILFLILIYTHLRNSKILLQLPKLIIALIITFFINAFVVLPFMKDMFGQGGYFGYLSQSGFSYGGNADLYSAIIPYISRFYNSNIVNDTTKIGQFLGNPIFITWTYLLWVLILGSILFIKEGKDKKLMYLLLIAITFFVFLAKGPNPPFERIYRFSLSAIPAFKIFRTTATVIFGGVLFYAFALTISVYYLSLKWKKIIPIILIIHIAIFSPIFLGYQFYRTDKNNKGISIPQEYFILGKLLDTFKENNKVLALPLDNGYVSKTWMHFGSFLTSWVTDKPIIHSSELGGINFKQDINTFTSRSTCLFTSIYNVGYLLWEKDSNHATISKNLNFSGSIIYDNSYFQLKKINPNCILPLIYIPTQVVYYHGTQNNLFSIANYQDEKQKPLILQPLSKDITSSLPPGIDDIFLETSSENISLDFQNGNYSRLFLGSEKLIDDIWYPYVRIRPDSLLYPLVFLKEQRDENSGNFDKKQLLDKKLFFASKRISELDKWGINNDWSKKSLTLYRQKMDEAVALALNSENVKSNLELIVEYIDHHRSKINSITKRDTPWDQEKSDPWLKLFDSLENKAKSSYQIPQLNHFVYRYRVPINGTYKIFTDIQNEEINADIYLNKVKISTDSNSLKNLGKFDLTTNENEITINLNNPINLINSNNWKKAQRETVVKVDASSIIFTDDQVILPIPPNIPVIYQDIKEWQSNKIYLLKINYQNSNGANLGIIINETRNNYNQEQQSWGTLNKIITNETLGLNEDYLALIKTDKNTIGARIYIYGINGITEVKSIELREIVIPNVYTQLINNNFNFQNNKDTNLEFTKINPTKYTVHINKVNNPFYLIFSESFNRGWELKINNKLTGKSSILPESTHFVANGFANAWYVTLDKSSQSGIYEIEISYSTQKLFFIGIFISLITILFCLIISHCTNVKKT